MLTPVLLSLFGSRYRGDFVIDEGQFNVDDLDDILPNKCQDKVISNRDRNNQFVKIAKSSHKTRIHVGQSSSKSLRKNKRYNVRVQSNISLSTISEESQSRIESPELKIHITSRK